MSAERLLGALVRQALGGGGRGLRGAHRQRGRRGGSFVPGLGGGMKGMLGMGALGVAIAAFDHFAKQQKGAGAQSFAGALPPSSAPAAPAAAGAASAAARPVPPPPPPGPGARSVPPPPPPPRGAASFEPAAPPATPSAGEQDEALLLVRAMIAAANADHELDDDERRRIVSAVEESGIGEDEKRALLDELERPLDVATLAAAATTPALQRDVYLASEMAIDADSRAEQNYLARLARQLGLDETQVAELRQVLLDSGSAET